jgi:serine/threonine protein phosphatase PrpC
MWKVIAERELGTSHEKVGGVCQDAYAYSEFPHALSPLIACCADGAGSAAFSETGSRVACDALLRAVSRHFDHDDTVAGPDRAKVVEWFMEVRNEVEVKAAELNRPPRDLACTLLMVVATNEWTAAAQVGDGVIVVGRDAGYEAVTWPQSGEYQNTTYFLTDPELEPRIQYVILDSKVDELALLTDGLQPLALNLALRAVHTPFFSPFFHALRTIDDHTTLSIPLLQFLKSKQVNDRTDDDKTLILACRRDGALNVR